MNNLVFLLCSHPCLPLGDRKRGDLEKHILSNYGNMDIMLAEGNSNSIETELENVMNGPARHQDSESLLNRENSSRKK